VSQDPADFDYRLPAALIAQRPLAERSASRLLALGEGAALADLRFADIERLLRPGDLLVVNETRVIPARMHGHKASGGRVEMLVERILDPDVALVQLRASHAPATGVRILFDGGEATVLGRDGQFYRLRFSRPVTELLDAAGHMPLPPYIRRADEPADRERYQTIFAHAAGSVAAPTAGLHFDPALVERLAQGGVGLARVTLHVGAGTFAPLREAQLSSGRLHAERVRVGSEAVTAVHAARRAGGRVVAVGTTVVRALETAAAAAGGLAPYEGETELFIRPGYRFRVVDALVTNFHLPRSSLLMLVCAFGGTDRVLAAYRHAVAEGYRFFSYGDAMFLDRARELVRGF
jgi:S-adenosylmethionine:tRNA ribosyltransferase-isomerase